ncbi:MAG TPA: hypothetical protein VF408_02625 [Sediminibacterium sp.]
MKPLIVICLLLTACTKQQDTERGVADLHFTRDTVYVREKDYSNINQTNNGMVMVYAAPAQHQLNLSYSETSGKVHFSYRGMRLTDSRPFVVAADSSGLFCSADEPGVYSVDFYLTDQLGRVVHKALVVSCVQSAKPVVALQVEQAGASPDNWMYYFDALQSRQPYGAILSYCYLINGQSVITTSPLLKWYFHQPGNQEVFFHVLDDLGISSDTLHYSIQIP